MEDDVSKDLQNAFAVGIPLPDGGEELKSVPDGQYDFYNGYYKGTPQVPQSGPLHLSASEVQLVSQALKQRMGVVTYPDEQFESRYKLCFKKNNDEIECTLPKKAHQTDSGYDIYASGYYAIKPGTWEMIHTNWLIQLPVGYEGQVRPRSSLAKNYGVTVLNSPGTIDQNYRGELCVILINHGPDEFRVKPGDRVAQLVLAPVTTHEVVEVEELTETDRGDKGFGSTGR